VHLIVDVGDVVPGGDVVGALPLAVDQGLGRGRDFSVGTIVTFRPWAANRPSIWAMYRPAESMAGNASTTMLVFSSGSFAAPLPDPLEHPAASIVTATADAMTMFRVFNLAPTGIAGSVRTPRAGWVCTAIGNWMGNGGS